MADDINDRLNEVLFCYDALCIIDALTWYTIGDFNICNI